MDLRHHWPSIDHTDLTPPDSSNSGPQHSPAGDWDCSSTRKAWNLRVKEAARASSKAFFAKWAEGNTHRTRAYVTDTLAGLPPCPQPGKTPTWLKCQLPLGVQQRLLQRRVLATDLATHTPSRRRSAHDPFVESFCPLCARIRVAGHTQQITETFTHFASECPPLRTQQEHLHSTLSDFLEEHGGVLRDPAKLSHPEITTKWADLPEETRVGLLMGNEVPAMALVFTDKHERREWMLQLLVAAHEPLHLLFAHRDHLITALYPAAQRANGPA